MRQRDAAATATETPALQFMAFSETLTIRLRDYFLQNEVVFEEKKMMGGLCFMIDDKMCVGINKNDLMLRTDLGIYEDLLTQEGARPMDFTGRPMKGFLFVEEDAVKSEDAFRFWMDLALEFNPRAKSSKKKKKKKLEPYFLRKLFLKITHKPLTQSIAI